MKKLLTAITAIATFTAAAQGELTTKEFVQLRNWAETRGYLYEGIEQAGRFEANCFAFSNRQAGADYLCAYVPVSSDTADEAINAFIASTITLDEAITYGRKAVADARRETATAPAVREPQHKMAGVPTDVLNRIRANAESEWADDYEMQQYTIKNQVEAYLELHSSN